MADPYVPDRGDVVSLMTFDRQEGHDVVGRRPAAVVSPRAYNGKIGLALVCPVTNARKGYPMRWKFHRPTRSQA